MKIVRIIARLNVGGPAVHVVLLTHEFQKRGYDSLLVVGPVPEIEGNMEYYASKWNVSFIKIPELVRPVSPWKDWVALWKIYRILRREKPNIVHTHTAKAGTLGRAAAILARTPIILHTFHGNVFDGYFSPAKTRLFLAIERFLARFTDRVITVSESQRDQLIREYKIAPSEKIEVVRLGLDLDEFRKIAEIGERDTRNQNCKQLVIGWVGRFTEIKDPLLFVDFAAAMKSRGMPAKFTMVGDGHLRSAIEARISECGLQSDFLLAGWQRQMAEVYANLDIMVLTSVNEGTPVTMIEAMAAGCPFVAPNVGAVADLATGMQQKCDGFDVFANGIVVASREVGQFVSAAVLLTQDPQLRTRMGRAGHIFAMANFGKKRLVQDMEALYHRLVSSEKLAVPSQISKTYSIELGSEDGRSSEQEGFPTVPPGAAGGQAGEC